MDFNWTEEDLAAKEAIVKFAQQNLNEEVDIADEDYEFPREKWQKCAAQGIQAMACGPDYGGTEQSFTRSILLMEGLGYGCHDSGLTFGLNAQMWTVQIPLLHFGSDYIKEKYLAPMGQGLIMGAHCLTEPEAGSDVYSMQTTAEKVDGGYILNGHKCLITNAPLADVAIIFALTNPKLGKWGISAFVVESSSEGYNQSTRKYKMGMESIPIGDIVLKDCYVPEENILGNEGLGFSILNHSLEYDRCTILASQLGTMQRQSTV